ncbi:dentin sialophosphoprotein-like [Stylophora pistillata]|uniref:dentin sialophosphoprotein-like n=1 Tax=Stylophora pistillata TaxID=50429 RepID=UPI000C04300E|nr:dentin sialophosphoprotein-like [Stylophora pistillata]
MEDLEIGSSTDTLKGKDLANHGKVDLDDELSSGQFGLKESDDGDGKSIVGHQASTVATEGSLDFGENSSPEKSEAASLEKKLNMKDAPLAEPGKTQMSSTPGKIEDLEIGSSTDTLKGKDSANQEKADLDDELSSGQFEFKESDDGDGKSTVGHQASPAAAEGSLDSADNSSPEKSEATSVEKKLNMKDVPLVGTLQDKVTAIQEKLDLDDGPSSDYSTSKKESYDDGSKPKGTAKSEGSVSDKGVDFTASSSVTESEKTQVSSVSGKKEDLEIGSSTDPLKGKDSANQEKVDLNEELLSGQFGLKKESDVDDDKSTGILVGHQASPVAAEGSLDFADNSSPDYFTPKKESVNDDGSKPKGTIDEETNMAADGNLAIADVDSSFSDKSKATSGDKNLDSSNTSVEVLKEAQVEAAEGNEDFTVNNSSENDNSGDQDVDPDEDPLVVLKEAQVEAAEGNEDFAVNNSSENDNSGDQDVDPDEDPLVVIGKDCLQQGNKEYLQGDYHGAIQLYTEGLQLNCKDNRLTAKLYKNFENSLDDASVAVQLEPTFTKALKKGLGKRRRVYYPSFMVTTSALVLRQKL